MSFRDLAFLLLPPGDGVAVETGPGWRFEPGDLEDAAVAVWGRGAFPWELPTRAAAVAAVRRETALLRIRALGGGGRRVRGIHRVLAPQIQPGRVAPRARAFLRAGALVELSSGGAVPRVVDLAAREAGAEGPLRRFRSGMGGQLRSVVRGGAGVGVLRVGRAGGPADPARAAGALAALGGLGLAVVPRLLGMDGVAGASWSLESHLPGHPPLRLTGALARDASKLCARLPRADGPARAPSRDLAVVAEAFPRWAGVVSELREEIERAAAELPAVMAHGDLWTQNLLAGRGRLTGVLDWDAWQADSLPGTDLLHLVGMDRAARRRAGLGAAYLDRPWRSEAFGSASAGYWEALGERPGPRAMDAIGAAWWAAQAASSLRRLPELARRESWVRSNVDAVLGSGGR